MWQISKFECPTGTDKVRETERQKVRETGIQDTETPQTEKQIDTEKERETEIDVN